jgi:hypothetical protein
MNFQNNTGNILVSFVVLVIGALFYFMPWIIGRKKRNSGTLFFCNLFFGCTGVGWVVCLIWALLRD